MSFKILRLNLFRSRMIWPVLHAYHLHNLERLRQHHNNRTFLEKTFQDSGIEDKLMVSYFTPHHT